MKKKIGIGAAVIGVLLIVTGIILKIKEISSTAVVDNNSVAVIGGADGPTAVFIAGKFDGGFITAVVAGIIIISIAVLVLIKKKR